MPDVCKEYFQLFKYSNKPENTLSTYANVLNKVYSFIEEKKGEKLTYDILNKLTIDDYWEYFKNQKNWYTKSKGLIVVNMFIKWLISKNYIKENVVKDIKAGENPKRAREYLNQDEVDDFLMAVYDDKSVNRERNICIVMFFISLGIRISELKDLDLDNIKNTTIRIIGKGNKERILYLNNICLDILNAYLQKRNNKVKDNAIFLSTQGKRMSVDAIYNVVKTRMEQAGLDIDNFHPHSLRHTFAINALNNGRPINEIQEMLGHTKIATTQIYASTSNMAIKRHMENEDMYENTRFSSLINRKIAK
jgi:integrase/recombinase XerD